MPLNLIALVPYCLIYNVDDYAENSQNPDLLDFSERTSLSDKAEQRERNGVKLLDVTHAIQKNLFIGYEAISE